MFSIDIKFKFKDLDIAYKADVERGKPHTFEIGEEALADKLFWILCGLDPHFTGTLKGDGISFGSTIWNNVLALGDKTMFIKGTVRKNIFKALRVRADKNLAKKRTEEIIEKYDLAKIADTKVHELDDQQRINIAIARAHFRKIDLVVVKNLEKLEIDLSKWPDAYIIKII